MQGFENFTKKNNFSSSSLNVLCSIYCNNFNRYSYFLVFCKHFDEFVSRKNVKLMLMQDYNFVRLCFMMTSSIIEGLQIHSDATGIRTLNLLHAKQTLSITDCATAMGICRFCFT